MIHFQSYIDGKIFIKNLFFHNVIVFVPMGFIQVECLITKLFSFIHNLIEFHILVFFYSRLCFTSSGIIEKDLG